MRNSIIELKNISSEYRVQGDPIRVLRDISFDVKAGKTVAIVGESGSGKTTLGYSILNLIMPWEGKITGGEIVFNKNGDSLNILKLSASELEDLRGKDISIIFQDPSAALNPVIKLGEQLSEILRAHQKNALSERENKQLIQTALDKVKLPARVYDSYPHQLSVGQKQRALLAMAILNTPKLIIADEPTSGLDATVASEIIELLTTLRKESGVSFIVITHDLRLAFRFADEIIVLYAGEIVEIAETSALIKNPSHPYTKGLIKSLPNIDDIKAELTPLAGNPPDLKHLTAGCPFVPRCADKLLLCQTEHPPIYKNDGTQVRCFLYKK